MHLFLLIRVDCGQIVRFVTTQTVRCEWPVLHLENGEITMRVVLPKLQIFPIDARKKKYC